MKYISLLVAFWLLVLLVKDAWVSVFAPWPHRIGEGMMVWMASELSHGRLPYGDILAVPSVYACYGPLPSLLAAFPAWLPWGEPNPVHFVWAGRLLTFGAWLTASLLVAAIVRPRTVHPAVAGSIFLCAVSPFWSFWTFRTDAFVAAIEALILFCLVRMPTRHLVWSLPVLATGLALTKMPAAVDIVPLFLLSVCIRGRPLAEELRRQFPALLAGAAAALAVVVVVNALSGGWMIDNIIFNQLSSGPTTSEIFSACIDFALYGRQNAVLWIGLLAACLAGRRLSLIALTLSLLVCGILATKDGADSNYYLPFIFALSVVAVRELDRVGRLAWASLLLPLVVLPLGGSLHRAPEWEVSSKTREYESVLALHRSATLLSDDPYYSVLAGTPPLATDLFQLSRVMASRGVPPTTLVESATSAWGDEFIWTLLGREVAANSPLGTPLPHANYQGSIHVLDLSPLVPITPPSIPRNESLSHLYLRKLGIPAALLVLAAFLPIPPRRPQEREVPPR